MECLMELPQGIIDRRRRKHRRLGWDVLPENPTAQLGLFCAQEAGAVPVHHSLKEIVWSSSPPWREDDKDGHYVFAVGNNVTSRDKIHSKMGEGTFGQVLECWDRERKEMVAIKIIHGAKEYRDAAMIEFDVLQQLGKHDSAGSRDSDEELIQELPKVENISLKIPLVEELLLLDLNQEHLLEVQDGARCTLKALDRNHTKEMERLTLRFSQIDKYAEARKDVDRRREMEYQRNVAEIAERYTSAIRWSHEEWSRIMERKLREDAAALEEAKRLERAQIEKKLKKEKAQKEAEAKQQAAREAAKREAERKRVEELEAAKKREEEARPRVHQNFTELGKYDRRIAKCISKLLPMIDNVRARAQELIAAINDPQCPRPFTFCMLANKVVSLCRDRNSKDKTFEGTAFACGYLILLVTSQYPDAMDYILAEFNKVCIYTVPEYLRPTNAPAKLKEYYKMIGYHEEDGRLESAEAYLTYVSAYVKLYAAIIQSEIDGVNKPYGLKEGWRWIAMCLNHLPATSSTAVALEAFLKMAGFALHRRYGAQFKKILDVISDSFLPALKQLGTKVKAEAVTNLEYYITGQLYLKEPEGSHLATGLLSRDLAV